MTWKALSVPDNAAGPGWRGTGAAGRGVEVSTQTYVDGLGDEPILPPFDEPWHDRLGSDDYHIALVPRECPSPAGFILRPSTVSRVFVLPFTWQELLQTLRGKIIPSESRDQTMTVRFGQVRVDFLAMQVRKSEKPVALTAQQFKLLRFLTQAPERVFSRDELLNEVWGYENYPSTRTVDTHICSLRQKLERDPGRPVHFLTVWGMGYKFVP